MASNREHNVPSTSSDVPSTSSDQRENCLPQLQIATNDIQIILFDELPPCHMRGLSGKDFCKCIRGIQRHDILHMPQRRLPDPKRGETTALKLLSFHNINSEHLAVARRHDSHNNYDLRYRAGRHPIFSHSDLQTLQSLKLQLCSRVTVDVTDVQLQNKDEKKLRSQPQRVSEKDATSDGEEEPFADDGSEDEYVPEKEFSSFSDDSDNNSLQESIQICKRVLFPTDIDSPPQAHTSTEKHTSDQVGNPSDLPIARTEDQTQRLISPFEHTEEIYTAHFSINMSTLSAKMTVQSVLHKGSYECDVIREDDTLLGFLHTNYLQPCYKCSAMDATLNKTQVVILRVPGNPGAKITVQSCIPAAELDGQEIQISDDMLTTPLILRKISFTKKGKARKAGAEVKGKLHCCFYCHKMFVEMSSHLLRMHKKETEVAEISKMTVNSKERNMALKVLRFKGDEQFNKRVTLLERIPAREHNKLNLETSVTCPNCSALVSSKNFARHDRKCTGRPANHRRALKEARLAELRHFTNISEGSRLNKERIIKDLIGKIKADSILHEIVSDLCLKLATERYAFMHRSQPTALRNDRQHLRRMARLLMELKEIQPAIIDFEDFFLYCDYDYLIEAVNNICCLNIETGGFDKPALARVLRSGITFLLDALLALYMKKGYSKDSFELENVQRFMNLHHKNYGIFIGRSAGRNVLQRKAEKKDVLPQAKDVKLFSQYVCEQADKAYKSLIEDGFTYANWLLLGKAELVKIILFNRRRVSEVASMSLSLYRQKCTMEEDQKKSLSSFERILVETYFVMKLIGKRDHILHILLDKEQCRHLDYFLLQRREAGVLDTNNYLFGVPSSALYIDASNAIREFSFKCGASDPHLLRTTYLRKQVATLSQLLTMNDNQIGQVAKLMGHSQKVHEQVYRQDERLFQLTSWAKFLSVVSDEEINKYRGKTFDDLLNIAENLEDNDDVRNLDHITVNEILGDGLLLEPTEAEIKDIENTANLLEQRRTEDLGAETQEAVHERLDPSQVETLGVQCFESTSVQANVEKSSSVAETKLRTPVKKTRTKLPTSVKKAQMKLQTPVKKAHTIAEILNELKVTPPKRAPKRVAFTPNEVNVMQRNFSHYIHAGRLAPLSDCDKLVEENPDVFRRRCGRDLYNWVQYQRNKCRKLRRK